MKTINPYLNFPGTSEEAFKFYRSVFGGEFNTLQRFKDTPEAGDTSKTNADKIMHISLPVGKNVLMATDETASAERPPIVYGNNFYLSIDAESNEEADQLFQGLSEGGQVVMPMAKTFWGSYFGMVNDKFGVQWMVSHDEKSTG